MEVCERFQYTRLGGVSLAGGLSCGSCGGKIILFLHRKGRSRVPNEIRSGWDQVGLGSGLGGIRLGRDVNRFKNRCLCVGILRKRSIETSMEVNLRRINFHRSFADFMEYYMHNFHGSKCNFHGSNLLPFLRGRFYLLPWKLPPTSMEGNLIQGVAGNFPARILKNQILCVGAWASFAVWSTKIIACWCQSHGNHAITILTLQPMVVWLCVTKQNTLFSWSWAILFRTSL